MPDDTVTLVSTTDSPEEVSSALTGTPAADKPAEKPAEKAADTPAPTEAEKQAESDKLVAAEKAAATAAALATETPEQKTAREAEAGRVSAREKRLNKIQKQIDDLTTVKYNARRDADAEEARLAQLTRDREAREAADAAKAAEKPAAAVVTLPGEPLLDDADANGVPKYKNYEDFQSAHSQWTITAATAASTAAATKIAAETEARITKAERERIDRDAADRADQSALAIHSERIEAFRKTHADYDAVMEDAVEVVTEIKEELGPHAFNVIDRYTTVDADNGPAIVHYLAQHPDEMRQIAAKPVPLQIAALAKIDARLEVALKTGPTSVVAPVTKAPDPIKPVGSAPTASTVSPEDEDYQTYKSRRNKEDRERAGVR